MSKLLDIKEFCKDLKEITTHKIVNVKGKFLEKGLFSDQIFGPLQNYTCQCNIFHGQSKNGEVCEKCGVEITNSGERRKRFAKIKLPIYVVNPIFYDLIINIGGPKKKLESLMANEKSILYKKDGKYFIIFDQNEIPEGSETFECDKAIFELIDGISKQKLNDPKWKYVQDNIDKLMINEILVLPADLRPASKSVDKKSDHHVVDKINRYYKNLLIKKEKMESTFVEIKSSKKLYYDYFKQIQRVVNELYDYILNSLSKKDGLIRGHILGKRIDFSGRAVIVPDPTLNLDECKLPYFMFIELFKIKLAKELINDGQYKFLNMAIKHIDDSISTKSHNLLNLCQEMLRKNPEVCILNRQPSLHRLGMLGFKIKLESTVHFIKDINGNLIPNNDPKIEEPYKWEHPQSNVIKIHPLVCSCFNADFDGDQMAVYIPISKEANQEILDKLLVTKNLSNPANAELTATPSQDIILGIYTLTSNKFPKLRNLVEFRGKNISEGMFIFNKCLPPDYHIIDYIVTEKELMKILNDIKDSYDEKIASLVLEKIKNVGFEYASLFGPTMSLDQLQLTDKSLKNELYSGDILQQLKRISSKETEEYLRQNFGCSYMIDSGSRGSWDQARQIILTRGFISNFSGEIIPTPVKSSLLDGLSPKEFFNSTYGCRKGLLDVAINTGDSGYLSRKLIFTCVNLQKDLELDDCGTKDCLSVDVDSLKKAKMLIFRFYKNDENNFVEITKNNYHEFVGKTIDIRSPIFCKSNSICHKCYGNLWKILKTKFIGIIAAQSLGERSTQLILRTFHTSGVANIKDEKNKKDMKQDDIIADLSVASGLFHHFKDKDYKQIVDNLFDIYSNSGRIHHVHIEAIVSQLMWSGFFKWRLLENRDSIKPEYYSIQKVPSFESWILGLGFSNPKNHIIRGLLETGNYVGIIDKILTGKKFK